MRARLGSARGGVNCHNWTMTLATRLVLLVVTLVLVAPLAASAGAPTRGLYGTVTRGPIRPVCEVDVPCDEPAAGVTLLFLRDGKVVARTRTRANGSYVLYDPPAGVYAVRTTLRAFQRIPTPSRVRVYPRRFYRVNFFLDTGIR